MADQSLIFNRVRFHPYNFFLYIQNKFLAQMQYFSMSDFVFTHFGFCGFNDSGT